MDHIGHDTKNTTRTRPDTVAIVLAEILYIFQKMRKSFNFQCLRSVRYNRADKIQAMECSTVRMSGLGVCMAACWWVDV